MGVINEADESEEIKAQKERIEASLAMTGIGPLDESVFKKPQPVAVKEKKKGEPESSKLTWPYIFLILSIILFVIVFEERFLKTGLLPWQPWFP